MTKLQTASSTLQLQHDLAIQRQQPDGSAISDQGKKSRSTIPHAFCRQYKRRLSSVNHLSWNNHDLTSYRSASRVSSQKFRSSGRPNQQLEKNEQNLFQNFDFGFFAMFWHILSRISWMAIYHTSESKSSPPVFGSTKGRPCRSNRIYWQNSFHRLVLLDMLLVFMIFNVSGVGSGNRYFLNTSITNNNMWKYGCTLQMPGSLPPAVFLPLPLGSLLC